MKTIRFSLLIVLGLIAITALSPFQATAAPNAPFVVNSKADTINGPCDASECTLRQAIKAANALAGLDTINFNIAGCPCVIIVGTGLPEITDPVIINGYSQPGAQVNTQNISNNAVLQIQLNGFFASPGTNGLKISGGGTTVKGLNIVYFLGSGIWLKNGGANTIQGNWIGVGSNGTSDQGNGRGILVSHGSSLNALGGTTPSQRNLISGNTNEGIRLDNLGGSADHNSIVGNMIGPDKTGIGVLPNGIGIMILSKRNTMGQVGLDQVSYIHGNSGAGIEIRGSGALKNNISSSSVTQNGTHGIWIHDGASKNKIGTQALNFIGHNGGAGVAIQADTSLRNRVRGNSTSNGGLGIDLGADGVTLNDSGDADSGPNLRQNFPMIKLADAVADRVKGKLKAAPNAQYNIDLYYTNACDAIGYGEGFFVQSLNVTTAANGVAKFNTVVPVDFSVNFLFSATATDKKGNTSEFPKCKQAQ